jgi:hypothetical protein
MVGIHTSCEEVERGMLTVEQYEYTRVAHRVYGKKIKEIDRGRGQSRNTIKKALLGEYKGYNVRAQQAYPVLGPYPSIIDRWLEAGKNRPRSRSIQRRGSMIGCGRVRFCGQQQDGAKVRTRRPQAFEIGHGSGFYSSGP